MGKQRAGNKSLAPVRMSEYNYDWYTQGAIVGNVLHMHGCYNCLVRKRQASFATCEKGFGRVYRYSNDRLTKMGDIHKKIVVGVKIVKLETIFS